MGATKLLSERLVTAANTYTGHRDTAFSCVRFGNVLGSSGSVVPIFMNQIERGGPVTVTDPEMTRFVMPVEDAVGLVFETQRIMNGGEVFVLKMPALRIWSLAGAMISEMAPRFGHDPSEVEREIIGTRPGERIHEKLISEDELRHAREREEMFVILPVTDRPGYELDGSFDENSLEGEYTSASTDQLDEGEIIDLIQSLDEFASIQSYE